MHPLKYVVILNNLRLSRGKFKVIHFFINRKMQSAVIE